MEIKRKTDQERSEQGREVLNPPSDFTHGYEMWALTESITSRVHGWTLGDGLKRHQWAAVFPLRAELGQSVHASGQEAFWMSP